MNTKRTPPVSDRLRRPTVMAVVAVMHAGVFALMNLTPQPIPLPEPMPAVDVVLVSPRAEPEVPPPPSDRESGGGAPAAPSRVNIPPKPVEVRTELVAPPVPAPEPDPIIVGVAPVATPDPGPGQGGQGSGIGPGIGDGAGPGSGGGSGPRLLRGPNRREITREYPRAALNARQPGRVMLACRIRLDTRLDDCRVVDETPQDQGFGTAALRASAHFRFRPPFTGDGRPRDGQEITLGVEFQP